MAWRFALGAGSTTSGHMSGPQSSLTTSPSSPGSNQPDPTPRPNPACRPVCRRIEPASLLSAPDYDPQTSDRKVTPSSQQDRPPHRRYNEIPYKKTIVYGQTLLRGDPVVP